MIRQIKKKSELIIFSPNIDQGGVEKNLFLLTNYFSSHLKNVSVVTANLEDKKYFNKKVKIYASRNIFFKSRLIKNLICIFILIKLILRKKNLLIISFNSNLFETFVSKIFNVKIIVRINASSYGWAGNIFKQSIFKYLLKYPREIIVNSLELKKEIDKKFDVKTHCIYAPFNKKSISGSIKTSKRYFNSAKKILKIVFIGRLVDQKNPFMFLDSLDLIKDKFKFQAYIIGSGYMKPNIKNYIYEKSLENRVSLIEYTKKAMQYLNQSDLLVLTSKFEGLPNVLIEAQYLKKYIISTNCPTGPKEILLGGKAGDLIKMDDANELSKKITLFYFNKDKSSIKKKISIGLKNLNRFDFKKNSKKYLDLIMRSL